MFRRVGIALSREALFDLENVENYAVAFASVVCVYLCAWIQIFLFFLCLFVSVVSLFCFLFYFYILGGFHLFFNSFFFFF